MPSSPPRTPQYATEKSLASITTAFRHQSQGPKGRWKFPKLLGQGEMEKPPYSFPCMIGIAIGSSETGRLSVRHIYTYIESLFPYYKTAKAGWKNSVRHNLSLSKTFSKLVRCDGEDGKGKYMWGISADFREQLWEDIVKHQDGSYASRRGTKIQIPPAAPTKFAPSTLFPSQSLPRLQARTHQQSRPSQQQSHRQSQSKAQPPSPRHSNIKHEPQILRESVGRIKEEEGTIAQHKRSLPPSTMSMTMPTNRRAGPQPKRARSNTPQTPTQSGCGVDAAMDVINASYRSLEEQRDFLARPYTPSTCRPQTQNGSLNPPAFALNLNPSSSDLYSCYTSLRGNNMLVLDIDFDLDDLDVDVNISSPEPSIDDGQSECWKRKKFRLSSPLFRKGKDLAPLLGDHKIEQVLGGEHVFCV